MILKKPYAFLIKHFRIIHLLLLIPIIYLISKTSKIVSFFREYVANSYSANIINIAGHYINFFMYFAVIFILIAVIAIYYLMRTKKKNTKLYFFILLYYIIIFIMIGVAHSILSGMERDFISAQVARAYRDISFAISLPQYFFAIYILLRGIGFDIKQFNFANDLKDLEITDVDSEEFEFNVNVESYKVKRNIRRFYREFIYYYKENTFVFTCLIVIAFIFIGTALYLHFGVYNKTYHVTDKMIHNYFNIEIMDSMLTNLGYDGNIITKDKYYLVLKLNITNKTNRNYNLDYDNFRLVINNENIYPTLDKGEYFIDYGKPYHKEKIAKNSNNIYVLAYELNDKQIKNNYEIKILESVDYSNTSITPHYQIIKLNPNRIDKVTVEDTYDLEKTVNLKNTSLGYTTLKVNSYEISNSYAYQSRYCYSNDNCTNISNRITTDLSGSSEKTTLLILNMNYNLDKTVIYADNVKSDTKFFDSFLSVQYEKNQATKIVSLKNRTTEQMEDTLVYEVNDDIKNADKLQLLITVRNQRYVINLK